MNDILENALALVEQGNDLQITTPEQLSEAVVLLGEAKRYRKKGTEFFSEMKKSAHATHKIITTMEKTMFSPIDQLENTIKEKMLDYDKLVGIPDETGGITVVRSSDLVVTIEDASKVPSDYLMVDLKAITKAWNQSDGEIVIPGIAFKATPKKHIRFKK